MKIIRARKEHVQQIIVVWQEFTQFHLDAEPLWNPGENAIGDFEIELIKQIQSDDAMVLVAIEQEEVLGFLIAEIGNQPPVFRLDRWGIITDLGIKKEYRRNGIGEKMLSEAMNWFAKDNIKLVEVYLLVQNQVATSFWSKQGFRVFSQRMYRLTDAFAH